MKKDYKKLAAEFIKELPSRELQYKHGVYEFAEFLQSQEEEEECRCMFCFNRSPGLAWSFPCKKGGEGGSGGENEHCHHNSCTGGHTKGFVCDYHNCVTYKKPKPQEPKEIELLRLLGGGWADETYHTIIPYDTEKMIDLLRQKLNQLITEFNKIKR